MKDVLFVLLTVAFFVVSWLYVLGCDRIVKEKR
jgi:hypothetical protein